MNSILTVKSAQNFTQFQKCFFLFFLYLFKSIYCYEELYDQIKHCTAQGLLRWSPITLNCLECTYTKNNLPIQFLLGKGKKTVSYNLDNTPDDDSTILRSIGVDIEYFENGGTISQMEIITDGYQIIQVSPQELSYSSNEYTNLICPGYTNLVMKKISFIVSPSAFDRLLMSFIRQGENHLVAISNMRIWVNCMTNCELCYSFQKCLKCMSGYNLYKINEENVVCETRNCLVANCDKCPFGIADKCLSCKIGYQLDELQNKCINLSSSCQSDQYYDPVREVCLEYSKKCYYYSSALQEFEVCSGVDINKYKCPHFSFILFYDYLNGSSICGCTIENCEECTSLSSCIKCKEGTIYNQSQNKCLIQMTQCPQGQYYNGSCIPCDSCTTDTCCDGCSANRDTMLSIYDQTQQKCVDVSCNPGQKLDTSNRICICQIANCVDCFSQDQCDECLIGYQFNQSTKQCEVKKCSNVSAYYNKDEDECIVCGVMCSKCNTGACEECVDTTEYLIDPLNTKNCKRKCGDNCSECTLDKVCTKCINQSYIISDTDNTICNKCNNCSLCDQVSKSCTTCIASNYYKTSANPLNCAQCDVSCKKCSETQCLECAPNSNYVVKKDQTDNTKCYSCGVNCTDCDKTQCLSCNSTAYYIELTQKKNCIPCEINCAQCDQTTGQCQLCKTGAYYLYENTVGDKRTCGQCNAYCDKCDENYCQQCKNGYYRNPLNNFECIPCEKNCYLCSDTECTTCKSGFYKNVDAVKECRYCGDNCDICDVPNAKCTKCAIGYYINPSKIDECLKCGDKCKSCSSATECDECIDETYYQKQGDNSCIPCELNCASCSKFQCETCISNLYRRDKNNMKQCIPCDTTCQYCDNQRCQSCKEQYAVPIQLDPQICRKCIQNCAECDANVQCVKCNDGYYLDSQQHCVKCQNNCNKCTQTECTECQVTYYQNPSQITDCLKCGTNCFKCNSTKCLDCDVGFTCLDQADKRNCTTCGYHCNTCDFETGECQTCLDTFKEFPNPLDKRDCRKCGNNCQICDFNTAQCTKCQPLYYMKSSDQENCYHCGVDCLECNENGCIKCINNYSKDPDTPANCIPCGVNCSSCDFETNQCIQCPLKYYKVPPLNRNCFPCGTDCDECDDTQCLKCRLKYYPDFSNKKDCLECGSNCLECDGIKCTKCDLNYPSLHYSNKMNCVKCDNNCKTCNLQDSTCTVCQDGYYINPNDLTQCLKCGTNCITCSGPTKCDTCSVDYPSLDPDNLMNCIKCDEKCLQCNYENNQCTQCDDGYFINPANHRVCLQCGQNCNKCSSPMKCDECNSLYPSLDPLNNMNCIKCDDHCSVCNYSNNICTTCQDGYFVNPANPRVCEQCGTNCNKCSSSTKCDECNPTYPSLDPSNSMNCIKCDDNCLTCNYTNNQCVTCKNGYYISSSNPRLCLQCGTNCNKCSSSTKCDECNINYPSLDPNNSFNCIECGVNCKTCDITTPKCKVCNDATPALSLDPDNKRNCKICGSNCNSCDFETGYCLTCVDGYYTESDTSFNCTKCGTNCLKCDRNGCTQCDSQFPRKDPNNKFSCITCGQNCQECNVNSPDCQVCKPGYPSLDQLNKANCIQLGANCLQSDFQTAKCTICKDNSYFIDPINQQQCRQCGSNCFSCNQVDASCTKCNALYYKKPNDLENCFPCGENCKSCDENGCKECITNHTYIDPNNILNCKICEENCIECDNTKCTLCKTENGVKYFNDLIDPKKCRTCKNPCLSCDDKTAECKQCPSSYYINPLNKEECLHCSTNCASCTSEKCTQCKNDTFYVNPTNLSQCIPCEKGCKRCSDTQCLECLDSINTFVDQMNLKQCRSCNSTCTKCNHMTGQCEECPKGKYLNLLNREECLPCPKGCIECTQEKQCSYCAKSNQYYSIDKNECLDCSSNCLLCNSTECLQCSSNLFKDPLDKTKCRGCGSNCKECNSSTAECTTCVFENYYIGTNKIDCFECTTTGCNKCTYNNQKEQCKECKSGYFLDNQTGVCKKCDPSCLECDSLQCTKCPSGYNQNTDNLLECIVCGTKCSSCNKQQCKQCSESGYIVDWENKLNCIKCDPTCEDCTSKTCIKCKNPEKNFVDPTDSARCISCQDDKCEKCNTKKTSECFRCMDGFSVNNSTKLCELICKANNCQKCQSQSATLCQECKSGYSLNISNKTCSLITDSNKNNFSVTNQVIDDGYLIKISFQNPIVMSNDGQSQNNLVNFQIDNTSSQYTYQLVSTLQNQLVYKIIPASNVKNSKLIVKFTNNKFMSDNAVELDSTTIDLQPYVVIPQSQKEATKSVQSVGDKVSQAASSSILPLSMIGNFYIITNTIDYTGFLYFLLFTKIRYPANVLSFYSIFENFQFPFIPNLLKQITGPDYIQESPKPFMDKSTDAYFINNAGQSITIIVGVVSVYFALKLFSFIPLKYVQPYLKKSLTNTWEYSAFFDMVWTVYIYVLIGTYLQFYSFDTSDSSSAVANYFLFALFLFQSFGFPFFITYLMYRQADVGSDKVFQRQFSTILGGLNIQPIQKINNNIQQNDQENNMKQQSNQENKLMTLSDHISNNQQNQEQADLNSRRNFQFSESGEIFFQNSKTQSKQAQEERKQLSIKYSKYYYPVLYFRKALFGLFIVYFNEYPIMQLVLISGLSISVSFYIWFIQPFASRVENIKTMIWEYLMIAVYITSGFLIEDKEDQAEEDRFKIGWIIISFTSILLGINTALIIYDLLKSILTPLYTTLKKLFTPKTIPSKPMEKYKSASTNNLILDKPIITQTQITNQLPPTERSNIFQTQKNVLQQQQQQQSQTNQQQTVFQRTRVESININNDNNNNVNQHDQDQMSENFSFQVESVPQSQKTIRIFDNKPNLPSQIEIIRSHSRLNSMTPINQLHSHQEMISQNPSQHLPISPTSINGIQSYSKTHNQLISNDS